MSRIFVHHALLGEEVKSDVNFVVDPNGVITEISADSTPPDNGNNLGNKLLLPGFINAHSHAFHRHLRGRSEIGGKGAETFWAWRDNMYALVDGVTEEKLYKYCFTTFREMISAGITTVGEFHYVHHGTGRFDLDATVIRAANDAGIRIVLIQTLYERAGFDNGGLHPVQRAAFVSDYNEFMGNLEKLKKLAGETVTIAVAAHSARAVGFENIKKLYEYCQQNKMAFHIHLEEQPKEILDCQRVLGTKQTVSDILIDQLDLDGSFTGVHATYTSAANMATFAAKGANVCICPCTEGYLGDGIPSINKTLPISFGTDCNNRICFLEEMRWACYTQQMKLNSRSVASLTAKRLLQAATGGGARALALGEITGSLEIGKRFDAVAIDLDSILLEDLQPDQLIDAVVFSCGNKEIANVFVNGKDVYRK